MNRILKWVGIVCGIAVLLVVVLIIGVCAAGTIQEYQVGKRADAKEARMKTKLSRVIHLGQTVPQVERTLQGIGITPDQGGDKSETRVYADAGREDGDDASVAMTFHFDRRQRLFRYEVHGQDDTLWP